MHQKTARVRAPNPSCQHRCSLALLALAAATACGDPAADDNTDGLLDAKIFEVDMQVGSYDTTTDATPGYVTVASMLFGTFPLDPLAVQYTVEFVHTTATNLNSRASWGARDPFPNTFALPPGVVPGYQDGIVGGEYFIRVVGSGCSSGVGGPCRPGTESTLATESQLWEIRQGGTLTVTIEYE